MTNRTYNRPYSAGVVIKRPRLRRLEISFDGPPPPTPEGALHNGLRPHGGVRGSKHFPPGQFSFDKDDDYHNSIDNEYQMLVSNDVTESNVAPYWLNDVQREKTHSGESPLFTTKLLAPGKFEQTHGVINLERALLSVQTKRPPVPRRHYLQGKREYYRPNSTHHYLSATDLKNLNEDEENMIRYGRPTRTTLLRARQRTGSAPVSSYDSRREQMKRMEDARNTVSYSSKELRFKAILNRLCHINSEGESLHSFLTGARYNRAHLIDSRGMSVYGVYMPRDHPADCFMTRRIKDGEEIPVAPPDTPRSDCDETITPQGSRPPSSGPSRASNLSRPTSNRSTAIRIASGKSQSHSRTSSRAPSSRPRSGRDVPPLQINARQHTPKSSDSMKREPLPDELTMAMPDHINKGKSGVYVTLKGQKMIETVDSKLPRVTGVSFPNLRKSRDVVDELLFVNQPPPTPVDVSAVGSMDKNRFEAHVRQDENEGNTVDNHNAEEEHVAPEESTQPSQNEQEHVQNDTSAPENTENEMAQVTVSENKITERKIVEIGPVKHVNFTDDVNAISPEGQEKDAPSKDVIPTDKEGPQCKDTSDNVVFFMTEEENKVAAGNVHNQEEKTDDVGMNESKDVDTEDGNKIDNIPSSDKEDLKESSELADNSDQNNVNGDDVGPESVDNVIKIEISEPDKEGSKEGVGEPDKEGSKEGVADNLQESTNPVTAEDYPFTE